MILWFMKLTLSAYASLLVNYFLSLLVFEIMSSNSKLFSNDIAN